MSNVSDGYHTFDELYKHRAYLFAALCSERSDLAWKTKKYSDGTEIEDGFFLAGMNLGELGEISYHVENKYWDLFPSVPEYDRAPEFTGYTSDDVLDRIFEYFIKPLGDYFRSAEDA